MKSPQEIAAHLIAKYGSRARWVAAYRGKRASERMRPTYDAILAVIDGGEPPPIPDAQPSSRGPTGAYECVTRGCARHHDLIDLPYTQGVVPTCDTCGQRMRLFRVN